MNLPVRIRCWAVGIAVVGAGVGCGDDGGGACGEPGFRSDVEVAFDAREVGWMMSVGGVSDDLYAVGGGDLRAGDYGVIQHHDGEGWSEVFRGTFEDDGISLLNWVHRVAEDDVVVVGSRGVILRWNGTEWSRQTSPTDLDLWGVWGPAGASNDLWAVGGGVDGEGETVRVVLRFDGAAWRALEDPAVTGAGTWFKVWGSSADDVVLVGSSLSLVRWDGAAFDAPELPTPTNPGNINDLISVWGTGTDRVAVAAGRNTGFALTWDGTRWSNVDLPLGTPGMNGVFMRQRDRIHLAGIGETLLVVDFATGCVVDEYFGELGSPVPLDYHALFADESGELWAVGANFANPPSGIATVRPLGRNE